MKAIIKPIFTLFVVTLIVLPVPPTTIIGLALVSNPVTSKFVDHRALAALTFMKYSIKMVLLNSMDFTGSRELCPIRTSTIIKKI
jgi:hypothetical protein